MLQNSVTFHTFISRGKIQLVKKENKTNIFYIKQDNILYRSLTCNAHKFNVTCTLGIAGWPKDNIKYSP